MKCLTWDVTVPDTMAASHVYNGCAADDKAASNKKTKYSALSKLIFLFQYPLKQWCRGMLTVLIL